MDRGPTTIRRRPRNSRGERLMIDQKTWVDATSWTVVSETIRARRSNLNVDLERPVPRELIAELLDLAVLAPNHYRTNPWRFVVLTGAARARIGEIVAREVAKQPGVKDATVERQRTQFLRAPTVLV